MFAVVPPLLRRLLPEARTYLPWLASDPVDSVAGDDVELRVSASLVGVALVGEKDDEAVLLEAPRGTVSGVGKVSGDPHDGLVTAPQLKRQPVTIERNGLQKGRMDKLAIESSQSR